MNDIIDLIEAVEQETAFAEMEVCGALLEGYTKACVILENSDDTTDVSSFDLFQENAFTDAVSEAKGDKSENIILRILKFIPRFIAAFIRNLKSGRKTVENKVKDVEKMAEDLKDTFEHPENHTTDEPAPKEAEPVDQSKVTERNGVLGDSYGDDDSTKRQIARNTRKINQAAKGTMFLITQKSNWQGYRYSGDVDKDVQIEISTHMLDFVRGLNKETVDYFAVMKPVEDAIEELAIAFSSGNPATEREATQKDDVKFDAILTSKRYDKNISNVVNRIKKQIKEADDQLKKIKDFANSAKNPGSKTKIMISDVLHNYYVALDWMKYVEHVLKNTSKQLERITKHIDKVNTNKKSKITYNINEEKSVSATANVNDKRTLIDCAKRVQRIVGDSQKVFNDIIAAAYFGLDGLHSEILSIAKQHGITVRNPTKHRSPAKFVGGGSSGPVGYVNSGYGTDAKKIVASI